MIIVPDIHGRPFWRLAAQQYVGKEHIVFLGDYLDPYPDEEISNDEAFTQLEDIIALKESYPDNISLLLGNHDIHYVDETVMGSRFDAVHASRNGRLIKDNFDLFQMAYEAEIGEKKYLFSHAGILSGWIQDHEFIFGSMESTDLVNFLNMLWWSLDARSVLLDALSDVSYARWGMKRFGSMVWADVQEHNLEHEEIPGYYQIFGHTLVKEPVITPFFACLDCKHSFRVSTDGAIERL